MEDPTERFSRAERQWMMFVLTLVVVLLVLQFIVQGHA